MHEASRFPAILLLAAFGILAAAAPCPAATFTMTVHIHSAANQPAGGVLVTVAVAGSTTHFTATTNDTTGVATLTDVTINYPSYTGVTVLLPAAHGGSCERFSFKYTLSGTDPTYALNVDSGLLPPVPGSICNGRALDGQGHPLMCGYHSDSADGLAVDVDTDHYLEDCGDGE